MAIIIFTYLFKLTLLHSKRPKLHTILAFLNAIGLKEQFCSCNEQFFPLRADLYEKGLSLKEANKNSTKGYVAPGKDHVYMTCKV